MQSLRFSTTKKAINSLFGFALCVDVATCKSPLRTIFTLTLTFCCSDGSHNVVAKSWSAHGKGRYMSRTKLAQHLWYIFRFIWLISNPGHPCRNLQILLSQSVKCILERKWKVLHKKENWIFKLSPAAATRLWFDWVETKRRWLQSWFCGRWKIDQVLISGAQYRRRLQNHWEVRNVSANSHKRKECFKKERFASNKKDMFQTMF